MKKEELVFLVRDYLAGGTCPADLQGRYHPQIIEKYLEMLYGSMIYNVHANAVAYRDYAQLDSYVKAYKNVQVHYDQDRDEYFSFLPATILELPKNRGIRQISPMQEQKFKFWYSENNSSDVYDVLEAGNIITKTKYYLENTKVFYRNYDTNIKNLLFKLVVPFSEFDDDDEINLPAQSNDEVFIRLIDIMRGRQPNKQTNDNTTKQI